MTKEQIEEATNAGISRDPSKIANLSVDQILWLDSQILASGGLGDLMFGTQTWGDRITLSENNTSGNSNTSNPNKGKELTAEEKEALGMSSGGSATGTPNGWEPDDENKSKEPQKNTQVQKLNQKQESAVRKIDNAIEKAMKDHDIMGTLKDMDGNPVAKPNGGYWDHMQEMNNTLRGLRNNAETLKNINNPEAQAAYNRAIQAIDKIESSIKGYGI
ncbi:polymorphic toxin type 28 domain-containing protein [Providencia stuartii]|nr:polymorphic toxin type 28 domain-containing protein [Providencia stuartii]